MNKRPPIRFAVLLVVFTLATPGWARAQEQEVSELRAQIEQCLNAQTPLQCRAALPACEAALKPLACLPNESQLEPARERLLQDYAWCEKEVGQYAQAEVHYRDLHTLRVRMHGPEHLDIAASLNDLAAVLDHQGKYAEAESLYRQALEMTQKLLGSEHPDVALKLNNLGTNLDAQGKYTGAELLLRQALAMRQKLLGAEHLKVASSLDNLAAVLSHQGKYPDAEPLHRQALAMRQKLLGAEHPEVALSLNNLAAVLDNQGKYAQAEPLLRQALAISQNLLGTEHPEVATSLSNLAVTLSQQGKYVEAEPLFRQVLAMRQKLLGTEHPDIAASFNSLADVLSHQGKYAEAEPLFHQALAMRQKLLGAEHPHIAASLNNLADVLSHQGKYAEAEPLFRQALAMFQKLLGTEHPDIVASSSNLASVLSHQGKYAQAEVLLRKALAMSQKLLGAEHPDVARNLHHLASVLYYQGKYAQAELQYRQSLTMSQRLFGSEHPNVANGLDSLALVLSSQGKSAEAESLYLKSLAMRRKLLGAKHPDVAKSIHNVASVLSRQGRYAEAELLYRQALEIFQMLLDAEHPDVATSIDSLGAALDHQGRYAEAEQLYRQALAIRQKLLGAEHPDVALSLNHLAFVIDRQGKYAEAEQLYRQALAMRQKLLGAEHPDVASSLNNLAAILLSRAALSEAQPLLRQAAAIREAQLRATVSETRMQALLDELRGEEDAIYGLLLGSPNSDTNALALKVALLRKGRVAEAGAAANRLLHSNIKSPELSRKFADWQVLRSQREALLYAGPGALSLTDYQARLTELKLQSEAQEYLVAAELPEMRKPPSFDDIMPAVAQSLPPNGVLVEIVWVEPYQQGARQDGGPWGAPHYVALLLFPDRRIVAQDLGEAKAVDARVRALRSALGSAGSDPVEPTRAAYEALLQPLVAHLQGRTQLYLSLDGSLHLVPFDALHDGTDYLLGRYRFHYLTSGRDLLREPSQQAAAPPLLVAAPVFGKAESLSGINAPQTLYQRLGALAPLPGTAREARALAPLLGVAPRLGPDATEAAVRAARAPAVLHIATHGLFLDDAELPMPVDARGLRSVFAERSKLAPLSLDLVVPPAEPLLLPGGAGPLHRSALVLAGAARGAQATSTAEDGLLTADEARSLDLVGTQLVVLSACETGQGALSAGQGVYGLRRAFLVAGAETLVTSLWRVHDEATGELMTLYYQKLLDKKQPRDRLGGMVEAMQELRQREGRSHPYYWAPFLVIGQDGPLRLAP